MQPVPLHIHLIRSVLTATLSLALFVYLFALPWQQIGLYKQAEIPAIVLHLLSAITVVLIGLLASFGDRNTLSALKHPVALLSIGFGFVTLALAPMHADPMRSLNGALPLGVGALWYCELAVSITASLIVLMNGHRRFLLGTAFLSACLVIVLHLFQNQLGVGIPAGFVEWVGITVGCVALALGVSLSMKRVPGHDRAIQMSQVSVILALFVLGYFVSDNRAVLLAALAVLLLSALSVIPGLRALTKMPLLRVAAMLLAIIAGHLILVASASQVERMELNSPVEEGALRVLSAMPLDEHELHMAPLGTIWSRSWMARIIIADLADTPGTMLTGRGWGEFESVYEEYARSVPGRLFSLDASTASRTYWDAHHKANFHSHNMLFETLHASGVLGLVFFLGFFAYMAWHSRTAFCVGLSMLLVGMLWFPVNHMMGFIALLVALPFVPRTAMSDDDPIRHGALIAAIPITILVAGALSFHSYKLWDLARSETVERRFETGVEVDRNPETCRFIDARHASEADVVRNLSVLLNRKISSADDTGATAFAHTTQLIAVSCMMRRQFEDDVDLPTLVQSLVARSELAPLGPEIFGALTTDLVEWGNDLEILLDEAPGRTEFITPYVEALAQRAPENALQEIRRFLPRTDEGDPVREYLFYLEASMEERTDLARRHFINAMTLGYANLWPVAETEALRMLQ